MRGERSIAFDFFFRLWKMRTRATRNLRNTISTEIYLISITVCDRFTPKLNLENFFSKLDVKKYLIISQFRLRYCDLDRGIDMNCFLF